MLALYQCSAGYAFHEPDDPFHGYFAEDIAYAINDYETCISDCEYVDDFEDFYGAHKLFDIPDEYRHDLRKFFDKHPEYLI